MTYAQCLAFVLLGLALTGCRPAGKLPIAGQVTVGGQPVDRGLITFQPKVSTDSPAGAKIVDGKFAFEAGQGLRPGAYDVSVTAMRLTGRKIEDRQSPNPAEEMIAMKVKETSLPITISSENSDSLTLDFSSAE